MMYITLLSFFSIIQLRCSKVQATCLSREQFLASLDRTNTLVFEAVLLQNTAGLPHTTTKGYQAYAQITKVIHQSPIGWQLMPGSVAYIREIRPRPVDHTLCLPQPVNGQTYLWVTKNNAEGSQSTEGALTFYPGGMFYLNAAQLKEPNVNLGHGSRVNLGKTQNMDLYSQNLLQHDAPRQPVTAKIHDTLSLTEQPPAACDLNPCPIDLRPVCGTDGVLYQNECLLEQQACKQRQTTHDDLPTLTPIRIDYTNQCMQQYKSGQPEQRVTFCEFSSLCAFGAVCSTQSNQKSSLKTKSSVGCVCSGFACENNWISPICSTDGNTYTNPCFMQLASCLSQMPKRILHHGECKGFNMCTDQRCQWPGERCEVDGNREFKCVCPEPCPAILFPVCGNDGITYSSSCHLERVACLKMRDIWVLYAGQCNSELQCRTLGLRCQGYEVCSRSYVSHVYHTQTSIREKNVANLGLPYQPMIARCLCPECPAKGLGKNVCGNDGNTYTSECHLRLKACREHLPNLKVAARGACNACHQRNCKYHALCQLNGNGEAECVCPTYCTEVGTSSKVCGSDGNTYESECQLKVRSCAEQREVHVAHVGACRTCASGCPLGQQCLNGECVCRDDCPLSNSPEPEVCGTDGNVYRSECELKRQACLKRKQVQVDPTRLSCNIAAKAGHLADPTANQQQADELPLKGCMCNKLGSVSAQCDSDGKCLCKRMVVGRLCERCAPGYWGIQNGHDCIECSCHPDGSAFTSCDQQTGQCTCKLGVLGRQCSICPTGERLTKDGCIVVRPEVSNWSTKHSPHLKAGRLFSPQTTLLVRAVVTLEQPVTIELHATLYTTDGGLLHYQVPPTSREQMMVPDLRDHQFNMMIVRGRIECRYVNGSTPTAALVARSPLLIIPGGQYAIFAGVSDGNPWIRVNNEDSTGLHYSRITAEKEPIEGTAYSGGHRTIVVGRPLREPTSKNAAFQGSSEDVGFSGCLLKLILRIGNPAIEQTVNLLKGQLTDLAWIGVHWLQNGSGEAPLCNPVESLNPDGPTDIQSDHAELRWNTDPCTWSPSPCQNGGLCLSSDSNDPICVCQPGWQGKHCEQMVTIIPQFSGSSFIRLPGPAGKQSEKRNRLTIELVFIITEVPGLLFVVNPVQTTNLKPFIAAYVDTQSQLVVVCRVGTRYLVSSVPHLSSHPHNSIIQLRYPVPVKINQWHVLTIEKRRRRMNVKLDKNAKEQMRLVPFGFKWPNQQVIAFDISKSVLYLGGFPFQWLSSSVADIRRGMVGAMQKIIINGAELVLASPTQTEELPIMLRSETDEYWLNISQWQGPPCGPTFNLCFLDQPQSICRPHGSAAVCTCSTPTNLWRIMRELTNNDVERAEKLACYLRQQELQHLSQTNIVNSIDMNDKPPNDGHSVMDPLITNEVEEIPSNTEYGCGSLAIRFEGRTVFTFESLTGTREEYGIQIQMKTRSRDGLILLVDEEARGRSGSQATDHQERILIVLRNGVVELAKYLLAGRSLSDDSKNGGVEVMRLRAKTRVDDGKCHNVLFLRKRQRITLGIDDELTTEDVLEHFNWMRRNKYIMLGGVTNEVANIPHDYQHNFTGCIGDVHVDERKMQVLTDAFEIRGPVTAC